MQEEFIRSVISFDVEGVELELSAIHRSGNLAPIIFLHGFGSTKEDYADIIHHPEFDNHPFVAYDAPGCGETYCTDVSKISIPFLMKTAVAVIDKFGYEKFHIVGHSMGGLTALILADKYSDRILSFTNIEGNISPEDCFLSRQIIDHPNNDPDQFFDEFIERTRHSPAYASALYAVGLRQKVRAGAVKGIFESMVELSDHGDLMTKFLNLPFPKMFMYGNQNDTLSYLDYIEDEGVRLSEVPYCGHFPMYSNPTYMWHEMADFQNTADKLTEVTYE